MKIIANFIIFLLLLSSCVVKEMDFFDNNKGQVEILEKKTVTEKTCVTERKREVTPEKVTIKKK